ncbi:MAG: AAA family ATPase [Gammaproteobacteria bacterium]
MSIAHTFYFNDGPYLQALKTCFKAAVSTESIVLLTGESKTGKSRLSEKLTQLLRKKGFRAILLGSDINSPELLRNFLARELDLPQAANFTRLLETSLSTDSKQPLILIFDDADQLSDTTLMEIHMLCEAQQHDRRMLNAVLCGEPELTRRLAQKAELKKFQQLITERVELPPMTADETRQFVYSYANKAGNNGLQIDPAAANYLQRSCKGFPGPTLEISRALLLRRAENAEQSPVSKQELVGLVRTLPANDSTRPNVPGNGISLRQGLLPLAAVVVVASMALLYQQLLAPADSGEAPAISSDGNQPPVFTDLATTVDDASQSAPSTPQLNAENTGDSVDPDRAPDNLLADEPVNEAAIPETERSTSTASSGTGAAAAGDRADGASAQDVAIAVPEPLEEETSDSGLLLVTAEERGVDVQDIAEPEFETVLLADEPVGELDSELDSEIEEATNNATTLSTTIADATSAGADDDSPAAVSEAMPVIENSNDGVAVDTPVPADSNATPQVVATESVSAPLEPETTPSTATDTSIEIAVAETADVAEVVPQQEESEVPLDVADAAAAETRSTEPSTEPSIEIQDTEIRSAELPLPVVLEETVSEWIGHWQAQDLDAYFASYHTDYEPSYHDTRAQWNQDRRRIIGNARGIEMAISEFAVIDQQEDTIEVQFWLDYASPTYRDNTLKKLLLRSEAGQWKIVEETNLIVRR